MIKNKTWCRFTIIISNRIYYWAWCSFTHSQSFNGPKALLTRGNIQSKDKKKGEKGKRMIKQA